MNTLLLLSLLGLELSMKPQVTATMARIHLSDVLSSDSYRQLRAEGLKNLSLGPAPASNRNVTITRDQVNQAISANSESDINWSGPMRTRVSNQGQSFSTTYLEQAIREWVTQQSPDNGDLRVNRIYLPTIRDLPQGEVDFEIRGRGTHSLVGRQALYVDLIIQGELYKTLAVNLITSLETQVARVLADVPRGTPLSEDHISWEIQVIDRIPSPLVTPDNFEGLRAKMLLRAGTVLDLNKVQVIPLVERNQTVLVKAKAGSLTVNMKALALDSKGAGERVRLKNTSSNQIFTGIVQKDGSVELETL